MTVQIEPTLNSSMATYNCRGGGEAIRMDGGGGNLDSLLKDSRDLTYWIRTEMVSGQETCGLPRDLRC